MGLIQLIWCYVIPCYPQTTTMNWSNMSSIFLFIITAMNIVRLPTWHSGKESAWQCRRCKRQGLIPGLRRCPRVGNGNPLQYSCLENSMDRGAWRATVHGSRKIGHDWVRAHTHTHTHTHAHINTIITLLNKDIYVEYMMCTRPEPSFHLNLSPIALRENQREKWSSASRKSRELLKIDTIILEFYGQNLCL